MVDGRPSSATSVQETVNFDLNLVASSEYMVMIASSAIALLIFNINANGGMMNQFNRLMATSAGVTEIYNQSGSTHVIFAHIKGVLRG